LLTRLLKKMNIEIQVVEEALPNYETMKAIEDVENKNGVRANDAQDLFTKLGI